jgi:hypothetical protein
MGRDGTTCVWEGVEVKETVTDRPRASTRVQVVLALPLPLLHPLTLPPPLTLQPHDLRQKYRERARARERDAIEWVVTGGNVVQVEAEAASSTRGGR